jgi:hypothetical protein
MPTNTKEVTMKFNRQAPGHYVAVAEKVEIKKGIGVDKDKWFCYFPDDKVSYRRSYEAAKAWSEKYMKKLQTYNVTVNQVKTVKKQATSKEQSLQHKLSRHLSYVVGAESLGCVNTGRAACIAHLSVNGKSFYVVGFEGAVTDTIFERIIFKIKKDLQSGLFQDCYQTKVWGSVSVFKSFKEAEKAYRKMDDKTRKQNEEDCQAIAEAKAKAKKGDIEAMFTLGDYGVL